MSDMDISGLHDSSDLVTDDMLDLRFSFQYSNNPFSDEDSFESYFEEWNQSYHANDSGYRIIMEVFRKLKGLSGIEDYGKLRKSISDRVKVSSFANTLLTPDFFQNNKNISLLGILDSVFGDFYHASETEKKMTEYFQEDPKTGLIPEFDKNRVYTTRRRKRNYLYSLDNALWAIFQFSLGEQDEAFRIKESIEENIGFCDNLHVDIDPKKMIKSHIPVHSDNKYCDITHSAGNLAMAILEELEGNTKKALEIRQNVLLYNRLFREIKLEQGFNYAESTTFSTDSEGAFEKSLIGILDEIIDNGYSALHEAIRQDENIQRLSESSGVKSYDLLRIRSLVGGIYKNDKENRKDIKFMDSSPLVRRSYFVPEYENDDDLSGPQDLNFRYVLTSGGEKLFGDI
ncbi:MAG: hypothetical protein ACLFPQ_04340 [Candidatus Woesearchaeota archaeon]